MCPQGMSCLDAPWYAQRDATLTDSLQLALLVGIPTGAHTA